MTGESSGTSSRAGSDADMKENLKREKYFKDSTSEASLLKKELISLNQEMNQALKRAKDAEKGIKVIVLWIFSFVIFIGS